MSWHSGRGGAGIGHLLVFGTKLLFITGGTIVVCIAILAAFFPGTFNQVFGTR